MNISGIERGIGSIIAEKTPKSSASATSGQTFEDFYTAAMGIYNDTNKRELEVEQLQRDFASGKTDDYLGVVMAQEKAYSSLQFTIQVTNKVIEAYKEIMRIQI